MLSGLFVHLSQSLSVFACLCLSVKKEEDANLNAHSRSINAKPKLPPNR